MTTGQSGESGGPRLERLLPLACVAAAGVLFASELMNVFELTPPGTDAQCAQSAIDRHHYAPMVLAVAAIAFVLVAWLGASRPAAIGVAVCGVVALLLFLLIDLPDANNVGTVSDACTTLPTPTFDAKAIPQAGFWLELVGSLTLAIGGLSLASLTPGQLEDLRTPRGTAARERQRSGTQRDRGGDGVSRGADVIADAERFGEEISPRKGT